ncbi:hypothetical protein GFL72_19525 [Rhizobium leguminosarum bv. viciae]|uniref:competence protein CoiA n=1 Tax=Rhizobium leguminosarum TaxID=384 RepID=UPI00144199CF|nr:competence protein CoiA family protein [Rhizobium leguminosarum]NKK36811.1 hypothetical protein [Rhizobium leguminosarum bv. viciae]
MKFALVDGIRQEATTGVRGTCPGCGSPMIAKCGLKRLHHWAHASTVVCDRWWEAETEWHRAWKNLFPAEWQEIRHVAIDSEIHIADVKTASGTVVEFQHSAITPQERVSREAFYNVMVWIVDGARLKRDLPSFRDALTYAPSADTEARGWLLSDRTTEIVERWRGGSRPVFVDFGDAEFPFSWLSSTGVVWWLKYVPRGRVIATPVHRQSVIDHLLTGASIRGFRRPTTPLRRLRF